MCVPPPASTAAPAPQSSEVTITFTVNDTASATVSPALVAFTPSNYNEPQVISVSAVDDRQVDGTRAAVVTAVVASDDAAFKGLPAPEIALTVEDNDGVSGTAGAARPACARTDRPACRLPSTRVRISDGSGLACDPTPHLLAVC